MIDSWKSTTPKTWHIVVIVCLGAVVRLIYGLQTMAWLASPDQLAWGIAIDEMMGSGHISYQQLIHYPHEGGSILLSLMAICLRPFATWVPPLSLAALLLQSISIFIQIMVCKKLFGGISTWWFAIWTVFAVPILIPWGTVNFGLHSLAAFWPFVSMYVLFKPATGLRRSWLAAIVCGFAVWFSYDNLILIPACIFGLAIGPCNLRNKLSSVVIFICILSVILGLHLFIRHSLDSGFQLKEMKIFSIRGATDSWKLNPASLRNIFPFWHSIIPDALQLSFPCFVSHHLARIAVCLLLSLSIIMAYLRNFRTRRPIILALAIIGMFGVSFVISPFYFDPTDKMTYVIYRHLPYIIPLFLCVVLHGMLIQRKPLPIVTIAFIAVCTISSMKNINHTERKNNEAYMAAGWILVSKFGSNKEKLQNLVNYVPIEGKNEVIKGYGWGLTSLILENSSQKYGIKLSKLLHLLNQFPAEYKPLLVEGVHFAFQPGITPILDKNLEEMVIDKM